jgi:biotin synthase
LENGFLLKFLLSHESIRQYFLICYATLLCPKMVSLSQILSLPTSKQATMLRYNWSQEELLQVYHLPFMELLYKSATIHRQYHDPNEVQVSSLLSIKTGGCPEDCAYCPQAARYQTDVTVHKLMELSEVTQRAAVVKASGASRMCMGAAWREVRDNSDFDRVLEMVQHVNSMGLEVCCTLGMLTEQQAEKLAAAGLYAYNHNLDSSAEFYGEIIHTRNYEDRLNTLGHVRKAGISVCSGGIIGMGESVEDRIGMLLTLSSMNPHPESVPVNALVPVAGTPLEDQPLVDIFEMVRMIATARIAMPASVVRLSAGRTRMTIEGQALCFMAGANSIFAGEKLLTTPNPDFDDDMNMFKKLGLKSREPFKVPNRTTQTVEA